MGRDHYLPAWFGAVHPKYRTPYRSIIFLVPVALVFALGAPLDQVITFSILSGLLEYTFMPINVIMFRKKWPLDTIKRGYVHPFHPLPALVLLALCAVTYFAVFLRLWHAAYRHGRFLHRGVAVVPLLALPLREARRPVHHALAQAVALLLPGMGQVLNRQPVRGLVFVCFAVLLGGFTLKTAAPDVSFVGKLSGAIFVWAMAALDAYKTAKIKDAVWQHAQRNG
jgi:hypothetical protein